MDERVDQAHRLRHIVCVKIDLPRARFAVEIVRQEVNQEHEAYRVCSNSLKCENAPRSHPDILLSTRDTPRLSEPSLSRRRQALRAGFANRAGVSTAAW